MEKHKNYWERGRPARKYNTLYKYNPQGMRIQKIEDYGSTPIVTDYLIDPYNHTGYAQVLQETVDDGGSDWTRINYTLGDDVIAQNVDGTIDYLLYDGHGSTRQLAYWTGTGSEIGITDTYSYDGYGVLLQNETAVSGNPGYTSQQATNLLYSGEQFDANAQQYYLRARYYNPLNGVFNRVDPYSGNTQDPQSLHKYAYVHNNPVNGIDPSGKFISMCIDVLNTMIIRSMVFVTTTPVLMNALSITMGMMAIFNLYVFATDPEAVDMFVASCNGDLTMASGIIAMDIMAIRNMTSTIGGMMRSAPSAASKAKNVITLKWNGKGALRDFWRKARRLQNGAQNSGLVYVGATDDLQPSANKARAAYRKAVKSRLLSLFKSRGMSDSQAADRAAKIMQRVQADHSIDLQISGALDNPNSFDNLKMLDSSTNGSIGKQIELECKRLGLSPGDFIDDIIIDAPASP